MYVYHIAMLSVLSGELFCLGSVRNVNNVLFPKNILILSFFST